MSANNLLIARWFSVGLCKYASSYRSRRPSGIWSEKRNDHRSLTDDPFAPSLELPSALAQLNEWVLVEGVGHKRRIIQPSMWNYVWNVWELFLWRWSNAQRNDLEKERTMNSSSKFTREWGKSGEHPGSHTGAAVREPPCPRLPVQPVRWELCNAHIRHLTMWIFSVFQRKPAKATVV